jgi:ABC-type amino acid transport substrate-binding protein
MRATCVFLLWWILLGCAEARPLQIVAEEYAPATFEEKAGPAGIDVDVAKAVFDKLGVAYEIRLVPWERAWAMLRTGEADVGLHVSYSEDRSRDLFWPKTAVWQADFVFFTNDATKAVYDFKTYDQVKQASVRIGITNGNSYYPSFWEAFPSPDRANQHYYPQLEAGNDPKTNMRKTALNRIQLVPLPKIVGIYTMKSLHLTNLTYYDWVLFSKPYPNAFSQHSTFHNARYANIQALMQAYDLELAKLKNNAHAYQKLFDPYDVNYSDVAATVVP